MSVLTDPEVMLNDRLTAEFEYIDGLDPSSEEKTEAVNNLEKLYKLKIEESNKAMEIAKIKDAKIDRAIRVIIAGCELMIPLIFYGRWVKLGYETEGKGEIITSATLRGLTKHFKPTKR